MSEVLLSAAAQSSLDALRVTKKNSYISSQRLSTGKRVNSALDNPSSYFSSQSLRYAANDVNTLIDAMQQATKILKVADAAIKAGLKNLENLKAVATAALQTSDATEITAKATQFDALRTQHDQLVGDAKYQDKNLIAGSGTDLEVKFNADGSSLITITSVDLTAGGVGVEDSATVKDPAAVAAGWSDATDGAANIEASLAQIEAAMVQLRTQAGTFGSSLSVVRNREDFSTELKSSYVEGADLLVIADVELEGVNLQTSNTRQQMAYASLGMITKNQQGVLQILR